VGLEHRVLEKSLGANGGGTPGAEEKEWDGGEGTSRVGSTHHKPGFRQGLQKL